MGGLGMTEILLIGGIALLFFGPSRLPSLGQALGKTISNFKKGLQDTNSEETDCGQIKGSSK
jgi:sec-independent protein translocase protein TatA